MPTGIPYADALSHYTVDEPRKMRDQDISVEDLLSRYHPDHRKNTASKLLVGPNRGDICQKELAVALQANARIDEVDLAGADIVKTDVLVVGGGGAGCAAALTAAKNGAKVLLVTKLRLGDSNTVMAEGGIQACIGADDSPQRHYDDTLRGGHNTGESALVAQMVMDSPDVIRWLIQQGMLFDQEPGSNLTAGNLRLKKPGGATAARILSFKDYTGLEMMRVLREAVIHHPDITVWDRSPVVELLTNDYGDCAGCVSYWLTRNSYTQVKAKAVILATGGIGRMHLNGFPTSNHFGATGDGLVLAYRLGAKLRDLDTFQYHPSGVAYPRHKVGSLITEAIRSSGAQLLNGRGERFVDELKARDHVSSAIIRECEEGRGINTPDGTQGVFLDIPTLASQQPGILDDFGSLTSLADKCNIDPKQTPILVYPTLHYQNGGVKIDENGASSVSGLFCVGEMSGGIHGRNRLMGNALLDIISFGRKAGAKAAEMRHREPHRKVSIDHVHQWQRKLTLAGLPLDIKTPALFPEYANFDKKG